MSHFVTILFIILDENFLLSYSLTCTAIHVFDATVQFEIINTSPSKWTRCPSFLVRGAMIKRSCPLEPQLPAEDGWRWGRAASLGKRVLQRIRSDTEAGRTEITMRISMFSMKDWRYWSVSSFLERLRFTYSEYSMRHREERNGSSFCFVPLECGVIGGTLKQSKYPLSL
jgi:hypothetical protein